MPYITKNKRETLDANHANPENTGELTYAITKIVNDYLMAGDKCFQRYAETIAALECAKLELYRRRISNYEDSKIELNGDVYE